MHRHQYKGKKFSLKKSPRELMIRNLATSILLYEKVKTTTTKAKAVQSKLEIMITYAKSGTLSDIRRINSYLLDESAAKKLLLELAPLYKSRPGGYTRVIKVGQRAGDNAGMSIIELLDVEKLDRKVEPIVKKIKKTQPKATPKKSDDAKKPGKKAKKEIK